MKVGLAALAAFIATILLANWLVSRFGVVPVGFGLEAPAAVFAAGIAFTLRDLVQEELGRVAVVVAIVAGAVVSLLVASPGLAAASGTAFLVSELADLAVYAPLREKTWLGAVAVSNTVGAALDSIIFLSLAFGSLQFLPGQMLGKTWMTAAAIVLLVAVKGRRAVSPGYA